MYPRNRSTLRLSVAWVRVSRSVEGVQAAMDETKRIARAVDAR